MPIDPSILFKAQPIQLESPVNAMTKAMQLRAMQDESDVNSLRRTDLEQAQIERKNLNTLFADPRFNFGTPESLQQIAKAAPSQLPAFQKLFVEREKEQRLAKAAELDGISKAVNIGRDLAASAQNQEQWDQFRGFIKENAAPLLGSIPGMFNIPNKEATIMTADRVAGQINERMKGFNLGPGYGRFEPSPLGGSPRMVASMPAITEPRQQPPQTGIREGAPGQDSYAFQLTPGPTGPVIQTTRIPDTAKQPAALTEKDKLKLKKEIANDYTALNSIVDSSNDTVSLVNQLVKHPGLKGVTGFRGMFPSIPEGDAAAAEAIQKSLKGKVTQLGKQIADSSGKIGPMALGEWKIVSDMVTSLDPTKGMDAYLAQLQDIKDALVKLTARTAERFNGLYEDQLGDYPQFSEPRTFNPDYQSTSAQRTEAKRAPTAPAAAPKPAAPAAAPKPAAPAATGGRRSLDDIMNGKR